MKRSVDNMEDLLYLGAERQENSINFLVQSTRFPVAFDVSYNVGVEVFSFSRYSLAHAHRQDERML